jgi:hypothetical protein
MGCGRTEEGKTLRCEPCGKFVAFEPQEPEANVDIDKTHVSGDIRVFLSCAECSAEMKEASFQIDEDFTEELGLCEILKKGKEPEYKDSDGYVLADSSIEVNVELTERRITGEKKVLKRASKHGKAGEEIFVPWKPRYHQQFYGFELTVNVTFRFSKEGEEDKTREASRTVSDEIQASGMDELM